MALTTWEEIAAAKRATLLSSIPPQWRIPSELLPPADQADVTGFPKASGWFTNEELEITSKSASEILEAVHSGAWTSEAVTKAFCKRAAAAHQLVRQSSTIPWARTTQTIGPISRR